MTRADQPSPRRTPAPTPVGLAARFTLGPGTTAATAAYLVLTLVMTWPLAGSLTRNLPADLGDPLLNCWILGWDVHHILGFLSGHLHALSGYWNANIFSPAPLALAYSEHLTAQALEIAPVYALTGNLVLCYNLLFLSTWVLSGLGTYLFVRELTGRRWPAFVAGMVFAFLPYRAGQFSHLQVLSSQWMPFALFGFTRYFNTRSRRALAGGALALVAENLSCGYYMVYFTVPFAIFMLVEIGRRRLWRDLPLWRDLAVAAAGVAALTLPFAWPYLELRALGFPPRGLAEVDAFSADVYSYLTTTTRLRVWGGTLKVFPKAEGELFLGFTAYALGLVGFVSGLAAAWRQSRDRTPVRRWQHLAGIVVAIVVLTYVGLGLVMLLTGPFTLATAVIPIKVTNAARILRTVVWALVLLLAISPRARSFLARFAGRAPGLFVGLMLLAAWMSLGPYLHSFGRDLHGGSVYGVFYDWMPGFNGLRVPARYGMIVGLFLAVVAGYGALAVERRRRIGVPLLVAACLLILMDAWVAPIGLSEQWPDVNHQEVELPRGPIPARADFPPVYAFVRTLPAGAPIAEFPFGEYPITLRYMYFSTAHWHPLLDGYSGGFPKAYLVTREALRHVLTKPDVAWSALAASDAAYAIVHEGLYLGARGPIVTAWIESHGARPIANFGGDRVFALPGH